MPVARVKMPDGRIARVEVPEGTTPEQAVAIANRVVPRAQPKPQQSFLQQLGETAAQRVASVAKGVTWPAQALEDTARAVETGVNYGLDVLGTKGLRTIGANNAADWWHRGATGARRDIARTPTVRGAIERVVAPPTSTAGKVADFAGEMAGSMLVPLPGPPAKTPKLPQPSVTAPRQLVEEGKRAGVRVMTSDVLPPKTFLGKTTQAIGERIPFAGTGGPRAAQQGQRVEAVKSVLREFGGDDATRLFDDAPSALDDVAKNLAGKRGKDLSRLSGQKNAIIDGLEGTVPVDRTVTAIDDQIAKLGALRLPELSPVITKLQGWREAIKGQSLRNVEEIRKAMGTAFDEPGLAGIKTTGQKALNAIYDPMRAEMGTFIRSRGGEEAFKRWSTSNQQLAAMAGELDNVTLRGVLRTSEMTPENVGRLLFSKNRSDVARLYGNLDEFGKSRAQAAILQRAFDKAISADSGLSVERFSNNVKAMGDSVGVTFRAADRNRIDGLVRVLDATRRASTASAAPPTGVQNTPIALGYGLGALFGKLAIPVGAVGGFAARAYESAPMRNLLLALGRAPAGSKAEARLLQRAVPMMAALIEREGAAMNDNIAAAASRSPASGVHAEEEDKDIRRKPVGY